MITLRKFLTFRCAALLLVASCMVSCTDSNQTDKKLSIEIPDGKEVALRGKLEVGMGMDGTVDKKFQTLDETLALELTDSTRFVNINVRGGTVEWSLGNGVEYRVCGSISHPKARPDPQDLTRVYVGKPANDFRPRVVTVVSIEKIKSKSE